jgi:hypothetical protein
MDSRLEAAGRLAAVAIARTSSFRKTPNGNITFSNADPGTLERK